MDRERKFEPMVGPQWGDWLGAGAGMWLLAPRHPPHDIAAVMPIAR